MANFKTHFSGGMVFGAATGVVAFVLDLAPEHGIATVFLLVVSVIVGSIVPDVDSDSSVPFHVAFGLLSLYAGSAMAVFRFRTYPDDVLGLIGYSVLAASFVWLVIGWLFRKFTRHRGMVHSIPSAILFSLMIFLYIGRLGLTEWQSFLIGLSFALGYILHLVLDEIWAAISFTGLRFKPKKSFGTALKFHSRNHMSNLLIYMSICLLVSMGYGRLIVLIKKISTFTGI